MKSVFTGCVPISVEKARGAASDEVGLENGFRKCPRIADREVA
jgi:hypothetical protein